MVNKRKNRTELQKPGSKSAIREFGLSGTLGLVASITASPAWSHDASTVVIPTPTPTVHTTPAISVTTVPTIHTHTFTYVAPASHSQSTTSSYVAPVSQSHTTTSSYVAPVSHNQATTSTTTSSNSNSSSGVVHGHSLGSGQPSSGTSGTISAGGQTNSAAGSGTQASGSGTTNSHGAQGSNTVSVGLSNSGSGQTSNIHSGANHNSGLSSTNSSTSGTATSHSSGKSHSTSTNTTSTGSPQALNLSSSSATYTLGTLGNFKTVTIDVGGKSEQVSSTTKLTSAELLAADQVASSHGQAAQSLILNSQGEATGGSFTISNKTLNTLEAATGGISSLSIPTNVTIDDKVQVLSLSGDIINSGSIVALNHSATGNTISAEDITNQSGASITGVGPLTLTATQTITNAGTIKSANDLTMNAASFQNVSAGGSPSTAAGGNLTINSPVVGNSGSISAKNDVNFTSAQSVTVQQTSTANLQAGGNINFRDSSYTGSGNVSVVGGNLLSQQVNVNAALGDFNLNAGNVTGVLNGNIGAIHTDTNAGELKLGNLDITGDPAFYNQGNIAISGAIQDTNGVPLAIVASGNIVSNGGSLITNGGDLTLVAGAAFTTNDSTITAGPNWSTTLTITGASSTGGLIDLTGNNGGTAPITAIATAVTSAGNGGNVAIVAFGGSASGSGAIALPTNVTINTNGQDYNSTVLSLNGNVQILSGANTTGSAISIGSITANGGTGGGGVITLQTGTPSVSSNFQLANGQPLGTFSSSGLTTGSISFQNINGFIALFNTPEVGGNFSASTGGYVYANGSLYDGGLNIYTGNSFVQATNWTAGGASVTTGGYFLQTTNSSVAVLGEGAQYNITAARYVDFEGSTFVEAVNSPATMTVTTGGGGTAFVGMNPNASAYIFADNLVFNSAPTVTINGLVQTQPNPDSPTGGGNVSFNNSAGSIVVNGTGTLQNSGTFTETASSNVTLNSSLSVNPGSHPNGWVFNAGGTLYLPYNALTVAADPMTGNGGTIGLTFGFISYLGSTSPTPTPLVLTANGANSGTTENGGTISITSNNKLTQIYGTGTDNYEISANSGTAAMSTGGTLKAVSGVGIVLNPANVSVTGEGTGGSLNLTVGTNLAILGSLNVAPIGGSPQNYGNLNFNIPNGTTVFQVGYNTVPATGVEGSLTGNVTITNPLGITVAPTYFITGNAISLTGSTITNDGLIMGTLVGPQISSSVTFNTPNLNNATGTLNNVPFTGEIGAQTGINGTSLVSVTSPTALSITGAGTWDNTFGYSFTAGTNLYLGELFNAAQATPAFTQLTLSAGNLLAIGTNTLQTNHTALATINITDKSISYLNQATTPFTLIANGSVTGGINLTFTGSSNQFIGTAPGEYILQVVTAGPAAGQISVTTPAALYVNTNNLAAIDNFNGNLILNAGTNLSIVGGITQGAGNVTLTSTGGYGANPFIVGIPAVPVNGTEGSVSGAVITINQPVGLTINNGFNITGSMVNLSSPLLTNNGLISGTNEISLSTPSTALTVVGTGTYAPTAQYSITGPTLYLGSLFSTPVSNVFNELNINATGTVYLSTNTLASVGGASTINEISINATAINYANQSTTPFTLNTSSINGGGIVSLTLTGSTPLVIGGAAGQVTVITSETAVAGTGQGSVSISNAGSLTVNPTYLEVNTLHDAGASTNISLTSTSGNLLVSSGTPATGWSQYLLGSQGTLTIQATTSPTTLFDIGTVSGMTSGINTTTPITGLSMSITNSGGGLYLASTDVLTANANGGSVSLTSAGQLYGATGVETITAPTISLTSTANIIGSASAPVIVNTPANAQASSLTLASPIAATVTDNSPGFLTMGVNTLTFAATSPLVTLVDNNLNAPLISIAAGLPSSSTVTITAPGGMGGSALGITTNQSIGNGLGVVTLNVGSGTITENPTIGANSYPPIFIQGTSVALTAGDVKSTNPTNSAFETYEGALSYSGTMASGHEIINNNFFPTSLGTGTTVNFNYQANGEVFVTGTQTNTGSYKLVSWGQLLVDAAINSTGTVTLQTVSGGYISTLNGSTVTANTLNLTSDYGNFGQVGINAGTLNLSTTGSISLTNSNTGSNTLNVLNSPSSLSFLDNGQLLVNSNISTTNGNILLEATNTSTGTITVGSGLTLHGSSTQPGLGEVLLTIGAVPSLYTPGTTPANVTINETGGGVVYFGSNIYPNQTITAHTPNNTLNASGRAVIFNSDNRPTAITLNGNDTITGDPPVGLANTVAISTQTATGLLTGSSNVQSSPTSLSLVLQNSPVSISSENNSIANNGPASSNQLGGTSSLTQASTLNSSQNSSLSSQTQTSLGGLATSGTPAPTNLSRASLSLLNSNQTISGDNHSLNTLIANPSAVLMQSTGNSLAQLNSLTAAPTAAPVASVSNIANANAISRNPLIGEVTQKRHLHLPIAQKMVDEYKSLEQGVMILSPDRMTTVESPFGKIKVAAKSLVVLVATEKCVSIYNFHDEAKDSVTMVADGREIDVYPGRHVTVCKSNSGSFEEVNPGLFIPHRSMRTYEVGNKKFFASEFHIPSAIRGIEPLQAMLTSSESAADQKMAQKVFKTLAVLQVLHGKHDDYALMTPKPLTAYLK